MSNLSVDELIQLMRTTSISKVREFLEGLVEDSKREDLVGVACRSAYSLQCNMYEWCNKPKLQICKILRTDLCDIPVGTRGRILKEEDGGKGYSVEITGLFKSAHKLLSDATEQTKIFYFNKDEVEILPDEPIPVCSDTD